MRKALTIFAIVIICWAQASAQSVGLVLSGGGAKGMAHIGVIRVLEENNIPIDYIAGTSIGAIVGGLYAAGYSTEEMEAYPVATTVNSPVNDSPECIERQLEMF